jgi:hypothetical protein
MVKIPLYLQNKPEQLLDIYKSSTESNFLNISRLNPIQKGTFLLFQRELTFMTGEVCAKS